MIRKLPESRFSLVFAYSLLVAGLFTFTAWKAIEEDGPDFGGERGIALPVQSVFPDCEFSQKPVELWCSTTDLVDLFSVKNKEKTTRKQPSEPGSLHVDFVSGFGPNVAHPFQKFKNSFSPLKLWSPIKVSTMNWDFSPQISPKILPIPPGTDILKRNTNDLPSVRLFSDWRSNVDGFDSGDWSAGHSYLMLSNGCGNAVRTYCGQVHTGTNFSPDTASFSLPDCFNGGHARYRGIRWFQFTGTGDQLNIRASSMGSTADIQVYRGFCGGLICVGGAHDINLAQRSVLVNTSARVEYFIMLANFANLSPTNNMSYNLSIECVCGPRHLEYDTTNHFTGTGTFHIRTDSTLVARNQIFSGNSVTYNAAQGMHLNNGFEVKQGAIFEARVEGCSSSASPEFILNGFEWRPVEAMEFPDFPGRRDSWEAPPKGPDD